MWLSRKPRRTKLSFKWEVFMRIYNLPNWSKESHTGSDLSYLNNLFTQNSTPRLTTLTSHVANYYVAPVYVLRKQSSQTRFIRLILDNLGIKSQNRLYMDVFINTVSRPTFNPYIILAVYNNLTLVSEPFEESCFPECFVLGIASTIL